MTYEYTVTIHSTDIRPDADARLRTILEKEVRHSFGQLCEVTGARQPS